MSQRRRPRVFAYRLCAILGERFVYLRVPDVDRLQASHLSLRERGRVREQREARRRVVAEFIAGIDATALPDLSPGAEEALVAIPDFTTRARTAVSRYRYTREALGLPELEAPMRFVKQAASMVSGLMAIGYTETAAGDLAVEVAVGLAAHDVLGAMRPPAGLHALGSTPGAHRPASRGGASGSRCRPPKRPSARLLLSPPNSWRTHVP